MLDYDYCYCYLSYFGFIRGAKVLQGFWKRCEARSIEPNPYRSGFLQLVAVAETDAAAEREYYAHADYFYNKCLHVYEGFADAPGYRTMATLRAGFVPQVGDRPAQLRSKLSWKDMLEQGYVIGGSPATVRERLEYAIKELHTGHLMVLCQFGSMPPELARQNTELFAKEVAPHVRPLYNEWEDRWWPQPLAPDSTVWQYVAGLKPVPLHLFSTGRGRDLLPRPEQKGYVFRLTDPLLRGAIDERTDFGDVTHASFGGLAEAGLLGSAAPLLAFLGSEEAGLLCRFFESLPSGRNARDKGITSLAFEHGLAGRILGIDSDKRLGNLLH